MTNTIIVQAENASINLFSKFFPMIWELKGVLFRFLFSFSHNMFSLIIKKCHFIFCCFLFLTYSPFLSQNLKNRKQGVNKLAILQLFVKKNSSEKENRKQTKHYLIFWNSRSQRSVADNQNCQWNQPSNQHSKHQLWKTKHTGAESEPPHCMQKPWPLQIFMKFLY